MPAPIYDCPASATVALTATTAKTVIGAKAHANSGLLLLGFSLAFDGITATDKAVTVEICYCTFGANPPGTNSTSITPVQRSGRVLTAGFTAGHTWTSEPTTITLMRRLRLTPIGGLIVYDVPLGTEPDTALGEGFAIRLTAPTSNVNVDPTISVSRC